MELEFRIPLERQEFAFAEIRARAMKPSLEAVGRYDEVRVRARLLDHYQASETKAIYLANDLVGFFSVQTHPDHYCLSHLYLEPSVQGGGVGRRAFAWIAQHYADLPIRLNALQQSPANQFYLKLGFCKTHEDVLDVYYERHPALL